MCQCDKPGSPHPFATADQNEVWRFESTFDLMRQSLDAEIHNIQN